MGQAASVLTDVRDSIPVCDLPLTFALTHSSRPIVILLSRPDLLQSLLLLADDVRYSERMTTKQPTRYIFLGPHDKHPRLVKLVICFDPLRTVLDLLESDLCNREDGATQLLACQQLARCRTCELLSISATTSTKVHTLKDSFNQLVYTIMEAIHSNLISNMQLRTAATHMLRCAHITDMEYGGLQQTIQVVRLLNNALIVARMQYRVPKFLVGYYTHEDNKMLALLMQKCGYQAASNM